MFSSGLHEREEKGYKWSDLCYHIHTDKTATYISIIWLDDNDR